MSIDTNPGTSPGDILTLIRLDKGSTRTDIQNLTGLSRVTVGQRVDALLNAGLLREAGTGESTGGRRPLRLEFNESAGLVLAISLNTRHATVGVLDLGSKLVTSREIVTDGLSLAPDVLLDTLMDAALTTLVEAGREEGDVVGMGISVPGPVDPQTGRLNEPPIMTGWHDYDIEGHLRGRLDVPVVVENDANAMAMGELRSNYPDAPALVFLKVSTGIGAGITLGGKIWAGYDGGAGDIGHMRVGNNEAGPVCRCGARGCLAASASGGAIAAQLRAQGHEHVQSARDVAELVLQGDPQAVALVTQAGERIGQVMAAVVCILNPQTLVVGGDLASPALLSAIVGAMIPGSMPRATRNLRVRLANLGEEATLIGMSGLVVDTVYAPTRVSELVAQ